MRAATIAVQLTLWAGLLAALLIATTGHYETWLRRRRRRRPRAVHIGYGEHPIGSLDGCPGCEVWRTDPAAQRRRARHRRLARRRRRWDRNGRRPAVLARGGHRG